MPAKKKPAHPQVVVKHDIVVNGDLWFKKGDVLTNASPFDLFGYEVPHPTAPKDPAPDQKAIIFAHEVKVVVS